jgi:hypothetical protein
MGLLLVPAGGRISVSGTLPGRWFSQHHGPFLPKLQLWYSTLLYKLHLSFFQSGIRLISLGESFLYFDYGPADNLIRYGTTYPPEYNLTQVTVPVYLVHADNDPFAPNEVGRANNSMNSFSKNLN